MGCNCTKTDPYVKPQTPSENEPTDTDKQSLEVSIPSEPAKRKDSSSNNDISEENSSTTNDFNFIEIEVDDPDAFNDVFIKQRQRVIDKSSYRSTIDSWKPNTLQQLAETLKSYSKGKSLIDRHWFIFYWIACNIEYDTVSYFSKNYQDQTAEGVFRSKKGVCAGYANLYKYLCDELEVPCEIVSGYSKGYGFDDREEALSEVDHAWNIVEIYHHSYLIESTWGAGHLNDKKQFERKFAPYYFLPRPDEMIYHHLPEEKKWQLLKTPIHRKQYLKMPKLRSQFFEYKLEIIQPKNQSVIDLEPDQPYALVILKVPMDVFIIADLKLYDKTVDGGHRVIFHKRKRLYHCYFAPANIGKHKVTIYAKRGDTDMGTYDAVLDLSLKITEMPQNPISYPETWKCYFDYGLKVISPADTHLINLENDQKFAQILIRTPSDVQLLGKLKNHNGEPIFCGERVYYDKRSKIWRCQFAPNKNGIFDATIYAKKFDDSEDYSSAVLFKINADNISSEPLSYPETWQRFYDLNLKIISPIDQGIIVLDDKKPSIEIRIQTPENVNLLGQLKNDKNEEIEGGSQIYHDDKEDFWRCKFAPNEKGIFNATILAKESSDLRLYTSVVSFKLDVRQRSQKPILLLNTTQIYYDLKLQVVSPVDLRKIILPKKSKFTEICVKAPPDVELLGQLNDLNQNEVPNADQVYYDRSKDIWRCKFAPNKNGLFDALIMAKKKTESTSYSTAVIFQIEANHIPSNPLTFPKTWQKFYDYHLKIVSPRSSAKANWSENSSYTEILIQAPDHINISSSIEYGNQKIENGSLSQYDHDRKLWQILFAPENTGEHELLIFAKQNSDNKKTSTSVAKFILNVTELRRPMKFPTIFAKFQTNKCQIVTPLNGILQRNSIVPIHCIIPDAASIQITVDSKSLRSEGYEDSVLEREINVGINEVTIYAKYGQTPHYTSLIRYSVE